MLLHFLERLGGMRRALFFGCLPEDVPGFVHGSLGPSEVPVSLDAVSDTGDFTPQLRNPRGEHLQGRFQRCYVLLPSCASILTPADPHLLDPAGDSIDRGKEG